MGLVEALIAVTASEEGRRANETLMADEAKFIDFERSSFLMSEEHVLLGD